MKTLRILFIAWMLSITTMLSLALAAVNLNTASQADLQALPGVGAKQAQQIIAARPFKSVDDLRNVKGIGDKKFSKIAPLVEVNGSTASAAVPAMENRASDMSNAVSDKARSGAQTASNSVAQGTDQIRTGRAQAMHKEQSLAPGEKININSASKEDLERLPGIGDKKAQSIIEARPFKSPEDVMRVKGIKAGIFNKIRDHISTG